MTRMVPSQVAAFIDRTYPWVVTGQDLQLRGGRLGDVAMLQIILDLVDRVPNELLVLNEADFTEFLRALTTIRAALQFWQHPDHSGIPIQGSLVRTIRQLLEKCPDSLPSPATAELMFIQDPALRESIRRDVSDTNTALSSAQWKAATVLAGSVVEALLLWKLEQDPRSVQTAQRL